VKKLLTSYGVDWDEVMERFVQSEELYSECLGMLVEDGNMALLEKALGDGDFSAAFEAAHTLKGVAANMGLTPLFEAVDALVAPLRKNEKIDYAPLFGALKDEMARVESIYRDLLDEEVHE